MPIAKISKHITLKEALRSATAIRRGIDNTPNAEQIKAMKMIAKNIFEPLRLNFQQPIRVNSFFRSEALNKRIGGSKTSQHCKGEAIDIEGLNGINNAQLFNYIREHLDFDQLIWEFGTNKEPDWVHVSYVSKKENRNKVLKATRVNGKSKYILMASLQTDKQKDSIIGGKKIGTVKVDSVLNIREKASTKAKKIGELKNGGIVTIFKEKNGWLEIKTPKVKGWVSAKYVILK